MRLLNVAVAFALLFGTSALAAGAKVDTKPAKAAAEKWLSTVDSGNYGQSWKDAARFFQSQVPSEAWKDMLGKGRAPFGKLISRKSKSETAATSLPGAPDGNYVVFQFDTSFENKKAAIETVTAMLEKDGSWRIAGYFIK